MKQSGGCHCGKVRYEVEVDLGKVITCNCSICTKRGSILGFTPIENFKLLKGADELTTYTFNKHMIHHKFCKTCGILSFASGKSPDGKDMAAINVRCLDNIDIDTLKPHAVNGKDF